MSDLTDEQEVWLRKRIVQLRSRQASVGPFRQAGIARTIAGMKQQIRDRVWRPTPTATPADAVEGEGS